MMQSGKRWAAVVLAAALAAPGVWAQKTLAPRAPEQTDAQQTREELSRLFNRHPPSLRTVLTLDPTLLTNQAYLAPYPALAAFLAAHPEVARNPAFYVGSPDLHRPRDRSDEILNIWQGVLAGLAVLTGLAMLFALLTWLLRTFIDYRRWNRLTKVQTDVHTKLLDRFTGNEELMAYVQSPPGRKFLESAPIALDAEGPQRLSAPLGRILISLQAGLILIAGGIGLQFLRGRFPTEIDQPLHAIGILGIALGIGFISAAAVSFLIAWRLGLIDVSKAAPAGNGGE
jgi:hypothetical protein